ncbi:MAG: hypothetical protein R3346_04510 [Candidatus Spechtbacterales bacterium]|nr:hypothetical protein [Candidatus Spechtbacterales bacterium]
MRANQSKIKERIDKDTGVEAMSYAETLAASLLMYAKKDKELSERLKYLIKNMNEIEIAEPPFEIRNDAEILMPYDTNSAIKRAEWLVDRIESNAIAGGPKAGAMLKDWYSMEPQLIVVGVAKVTMPGPSLGRIKKNKRVSIIIRKDITKKEEARLADKAARVSLGIVSKALVVADGNASQLEPEISEWFFGERELNLYSAEKSELIKIEKELQNLDIIYSSLNDNDPIMIAVSPAIHNAYQTELWDIKKIRT